MKDLYSKRAPILSHPTLSPQTIPFIRKHCSSSPIEDILKSLLCTPKPLPMLDGVFLPARAASYINVAKSHRLLLPFPVILQTKTTFPCSFYSPLPLKIHKAVRIVTMFLDHRFSCRDPLVCTTACRIQLRIIQMFAVLA